MGGLRSITHFGVLLGLVYFVYTNMAFELFKNVNMSAIALADREFLRFDTVEDSYFVMFQVFLGANWSAVMHAVSNETSVAMIWFFISYFFLAGMLFTQLFIGILLN